MAELLKLLAISASSTQQTQPLRRHCMAYPEPPPTEAIPPLTRNVPAPSSPHQRAASSRHITALERRPAAASSAEGCGHGGGGGSAQGGRGGGRRRTGALGPRLDALQGAERGVVDWQLFARRVHALGEARLRLEGHHEPAGGLSLCLALLSRLSPAAERDGRHWRGGGLY